LWGVLRHEGLVLAGLARLLAPSAEATVLLSVVERDGMPAVPGPDRLAATYAWRGLELVERAARYLRRGRCVTFVVGQASARGDGATGDAPAGFWRPRG
jgi:hypothetical protein